ncbi:MULTISPECIES: AbrB/MazE/SpoVT family DNA-binding domain-containing protein [Metabacillus]|uniref:AbrB/MazE/SpoVT family DNA-binding domain-containing protein n=1 Tax=Metabacillus TaxID=2675233 RepID=UPI000C80CF86|nr:MULTISPECIES: AbrB/MazE/SpoVT family DNA-binding domain-containing protein [Metabacillus]MCM3443994.1 AbrB/MazE/SpoVT family DNA-binding domain-containing protein [Metabacillus halosaccharovorans]PMC34955.1 hypothetical protein CJ195_20825 [Bacillus sp. UMB0899]
MRSTSIVRKTDPIGRIVIPKEVRRGMKIGVGDALAIFVDEDQIILKTYQTEKECLVTGEISDQNISLLNGKIHLSPEAVELLINDIKEYLEN